MNTRGFWRLGDVSDAGLVAGLKELLVQEGRSEARVVAHLAELDARRLHLRAGWPSLFEYCRKQLGLSENQAYYRIAAARVGRQFPVVFELLEKRELHVTNVARISQYLTEENHAELLHEAGTLSKRELLESLARRSPRADAPNRIRRLPTTATSVSAGPTGLLEPLSATSYRLQLNASQSLKDKLELARDLMSHANPYGDLAVVVERALDTLIEKLKQRRFGQSSRPRPKPFLDQSRSRDAEPTREAKPTSHTAPTRDAEPTRDAGPARAEPARDARPAHGAEPPRDARPARGAEPTREAKPKREAEPTAEARASGVAMPRSEGDTRRHVANETRRGIAERDGPGCSYMGAGGKRCGARAFLEIHHEEGWAKGGEDTLDNLSLLCRAHNRLIAEQELGLSHIARAIGRRRAS